MVTWELARWLFQVFDVGNLYTVVAPGGVVAARNLAVRDLVLKAPPHITEVLMVDRDMQPCEATTPLLAANADIVGVVPCVNERPRPALGTHQQAAPCFG
jgi:hypothetical protein